jgi:cell division protein FtsL
MPTATRSAWIKAWESDLTPSAAARRSEVRAAARMRSTRYYTREATARLPQPLLNLSGSASAGEARPADAEPARPLPDLKVVTRRRPQWGLALAALIGAALLLGIAIVAPVLISSAGTELQSQVGRLEAQQKQLQGEASALSAQISALSSPDRVAEQAGRLGLGPATSVYYVEAPNEAVAAEGDTTLAGR